MEVGHSKIQKARKKNMARKDNWHFNKKEQHRLKREILLKVAAECFNQKSISGTSLKDVARKLGITDAALYYYVKNKEELVTLCYIRALDLGELALDKAIDEGNNCLEKLQYFIRYQIEEVCGEDGPVAILSEIPSLKPEHQKQVLSRSRKHTKRLTKLLIDGVEEGSIATDNPVITCDAILGALNWMPKWFKPDSEISGDMISTGFIQTFTSGLLPR
jgi:TetR/AcrR family transcriptional regulator